MLATAGIAAAVAGEIRRHDLPHVVLDTVMASKGGWALLDDDGPKVLVEKLFPLAEIVTANLEEAARLSGLHHVRNVEEARRAAAELVKLGARAVLVKGGHLTGPPVDVLFDGHTFTEIAGERIDSPHTHGTGCTLASAIAARLAHGALLLDALRGAKAYVTQAIARAPGLGHGHGPLAHGVATEPETSR
jgi:hydroxymethylpyrimidine/phosphomethylpyrimidine kinase